MAAAKTAAPRVVVRNTEASPSEQVLAASKVEHEIKDGLGRTIVIRRPSILTQSRITRIVGADDAANAAYMGGFVLPIMWLKSIDGEEFAAPNNQRELEVILTKLDEAGVGAILDKLQAIHAAEEEAKAAVKK